MFCAQVVLLRHDRTLTKVAQLYIPILINQNVLGLDISVNNIVRVTMKQGQAQLPRHLPNLSLRKVLSALLLLSDECVQIVVCCELHDYEEAELLLLVLKIKLFLLLFKPIYFLCELGIRFGTGFFEALV